MFSAMQSNVGVGEGIEARRQISLVDSFENLKAPKEVDGRSRSSLGPNISNENETSNELSPSMCPVEAMADNGSGGTSTEKETSNKSSQTTSFVEAMTHSGSEGTSTESETSNKSSQTTSSVEETSDNGSGGTSTESETSNKSSQTTSSVEATSYDGSGENSFEGDIHGHNDQGSSNVISKITEENKRCISTSRLPPPSLTIREKDGRYKTDFDEIKLLGKGGFGKVTEVKSKLDTQHYAVKMVKSGSIKWEKLSREVTILAELTKTPCHRIVRYHTSWLEEKDASEPDTTSSSEGPLTCTSLEEDNPEDSELLNVSKDSNQTSASRSKTSHMFPLISSRGYASGSALSETIVDYDEKEEIDQTDESVRKRKAKETVKREIFNGERRPHSSKPLPKCVLYIQMELCGKTLSEWLLDRNINSQPDDLFRCVSPTNNIHILKQILEGISFLHEKGILHRDLKPANVFLTEPQLEVKIGDFGLSREVKENVEANNQEPVGRQLTTNIGTYPYIAPEQQRGGDYDSKADMYSFGIIKYEMFLPYMTLTEKYKSFDVLRKDGVIQEEELKSQWPEEAKLIESLTNKDKMLRPSASDVLKCVAYSDHNQQTQLSQRDSLITEKGDKELEKVKEERDKVKEERDKVKEERDKVKEERDKVKEERDKVKEEGDKELEKVKEERDQQRRENEKKEKIIKELEEQLKALQ